ncbi:RRP15-like protein [Scaptodrosophila lebanonensis]|uniref:RRP15-like protein n=1 Tax=Drosophila lebanonensis TaxID=7225 RepID=A0A6J2TG27_DROLE|nr:RRP15-like protein [Scaptodrosophila lebanonensis]
MALQTAKQSKRASAPESDSGSESDSNSVGSATEGNSGWADSINKVLKTSGRPYVQKTVLARAKKSQAVSSKDGSSSNKTKSYGFEIDGASGAEVKEEVEEKPETSALDAQLTKKQRKNVPLQLRVKPTFRDIERERSLRKVATRGVVQFFNAVRVQQKELQQQLEEAGPLDSRQDAVLNNINKRKFLDILMSGKRAKSEAIDNAVKKEESDTEEDSQSEDDAFASGGKKKSEWNVLREDFMTNKKIKHWDEESEEGSNVEDRAQSSDEED